MKFEIISLIKNEEDIIENFIKHHENIVDQITLIDNGSTDSTLDVVKKYKNINLSIKILPFKFKENIINHYIQKSNCDVVIPLDADELMVLDYSKNLSQEELGKITKDSNTIRQYLKNLPHSSVYKIKNIYNKLPDQDNSFQIEKDPCRSRKIFVSKRNCIKVDAGFHNAITNNKSQFSTNISYLHLHYRNFNSWYRSSVQKMKARLGDKWNDLDVLKTYQGLSRHVAAELHQYLTTGNWCPTSDMELELN